MSLYIEVDDVSAVLLADGWHTVANQSFDLNAYEFHNGVVLLTNRSVPHSGAAWTESDGAQVYCPLTAVLAVRTKAPPVHQDAPRRARVQRVTPNA